MSNSSTVPSASPTRVRSKDDERVLVVPTARFHELGVFQGVSKGSIARYDALFTRDALQFMRRGDAERDPNFKQLIPYVVFTSVDAQGRPCVFAYLRGKGQGEARLRSKWSVGVGGHVNDGDGSVGSGRDLFESGAARELEEEVALDANLLSFEKVGLVNDDSTEVGRVHLGVVCRAVLDRPALRSNEPDLLEARFRDAEELLRETRKEPEKFESWTVLALEALFA